MQKLRFLLCFLFVFVSGCSSISSNDGQLSQIEKKLQEKHWRIEKMASDELSLNVFYPEQIKPTKQLVIYLGDSGYSNHDDHLVSRKLLAFDLAATQPDGTAMFIQWPCQQIRSDESACRNIFSLSRRFDPIVLWSMLDIMDKLKTKAKAEQIILVGYGDGGLMASLIAARREDVIGLVSIATPFDLPLTNGETLLADEVIQEKHFTSLYQQHFVGSNDKEISIQATQQFIQHFPVGSPVSLVEEKGFTHTCCWVEQWPRLWTEITTKMSSVNTVSLQQLNNNNLK